MGESGPENPGLEFGDAEKSVPPSGNVAQSFSWKLILRFLFPVLMTLFMALVLLRPHETPEHTSLLPESSPAPHIAIDLDFDNEQGVWKTEVPMAFDASGENANGMAFAFGTSGKTLRGATIEIAQFSSPCAFLAVRNATVADSQYVQIPASAGCLPIPPDRLKSRVAFLRISFQQEERPHLFLMARKCDASCPADLPVQITATQPISVPEGWLEGKPVAQSSYADRLAFLWGQNFSGKALAAILCVLVFISSLSFSFAVDAFRSSGRIVGWAVAACATGLALTYAVLIPPFQAPDESSHFLGYAQLVGHHELAEDAAAMAKKTHFGRIKGRKAEHFLDSDRSKPYPEAGFVNAVDYHNRSVTTPMLWRAAGAFAGSQDAPATLLGLRVLAAFLFGAALYLSSLLLRNVALYVLLLFPSLPFFAMATSDHALGVSLATLFAAFVMAFFLGDEEFLIKPVFPLGFALCCAAFFANSFAAFSLTLLFALTLFVMALRRSRINETSSLQQAQYWGGLGLGLMGSLLLPAEFMNPFFARFQNMAAAYSISLPGPQLCLALIALLLPLALGLLEKLLRFFNQKRERPWQLWSTRMSSFLLAGLVLFFLISALASPWSRVAAMPDIEMDSGVALNEYLLNIAENIATPFRLSHHDFFLTSSFFGGFGWLDVAFPELLVTSLLAIVLAGLAVLALRSLLAREDRTATAILALLGAVFICILVSGYGTFHNGRINLHGRYLIAPYILVLIIACKGFSSGIPGFNWKKPALVNAWLQAYNPAWILLFAGVYCITFVVLLDRYFGN